MSFALSVTKSVGRPSVLNIDSKFISVSFQYAAVPLMFFMNMYEFKCKSGFWLICETSAAVICEDPFAD